MSRRLRILYAVGDPWPLYRADVVELFARELASRGHHIDWAVSRRDDEGGHTQASWMGAQVLMPAAGKGSGRLRRLWSRLCCDLRLLRTAVSGRYDVIQVRDRFAIAVPCWLAARCTGAKFVYWMSFPFGESKINQARLGLARRGWLTYAKGVAICATLYGFVLRRADHVFVQSQRMRDDVAARGIDVGKLTAVPMGVRPSRIGRADDARAPNVQAPVLLHLGLIMRLRESEMMVRSLALVRQRFPNARLKYVGQGQDPADEQAVWNEAVRLGVKDAVEITGFMPMEQAWEQVLEADVCLAPCAPIPAFLPASPTKLVEYMAMARCVVANDHPDQSQVLRESGAGESNAWTAESFAQAICRLLEAPEEARLLAARGPDYVRQHRAYDVLASRVEAAYASLWPSKQGPATAVVLPRAEGK